MEDYVVEEYRDDFKLLLKVNTQSEQVNLVMRLLGW